MLGISLLILLIVPLTYACFNNTPFPSQAPPVPMTAGARTFNKRLIDDSTPYLWIQRVTLPLQGTSSVCSTYQIDVEIRTTLAWSDNEALTTSVVDTTLCGNKEDITFNFTKILVLIPGQVYFLGLNSSASLMWLSDSSATGYESYSLTDPNSPTELTTNLLANFNGECAANDACYESEVVATKGKLCYPADGIPLPPCQYNSYCTGDSIACPATIFVKDGTPCQGGGFCSSGVCSTNTSCKYNQYTFKHGDKWRDPCNNCSCYLGVVNCNPLPCTVATGNNVPLVIAVIVIAILVLVFFFLGLVAGHLCKPKPDPRQRRRRKLPQPKQQDGLTTTTQIPKGLAEVEVSSSKKRNTGRDNDVELPMTTTKSKPKSTAQDKSKSEKSKSEKSKSEKSKPEKKSKTAEKESSDDEHTDDTTDDSNVKKTKNDDDSDSDSDSSSTSESVKKPLAKKQ